MNVDGTARLNIYMNSNSYFSLPLVDAIMLFICRDGRIKVIGGDGIEGLLISPKQLPYKNIEVCIFVSLKSLEVTALIFVTRMLL